MAAQSLTVQMLCAVTGAPVAGIPGQTHSVQRNPLGTRATDAVANEYVYLAGAASMALGDFVTYNTASFVAVRSAPDAVGNVAIATAAITAALWGWFQIYGSYTDALSDGSVLAAGSVFLHATAGAVSSTSVAGDMVYGANAQAVDVGNAVGMFLNYPWVTNTAAT